MLNVQHEGKQRVPPEAGCIVYLFGGLKPVFDEVSQHLTFVKAFAASVVFELSEGCLRKGYGHRDFLQFRYRSTPASTRKGLNYRIVAHLVSSIRVDN